MTFGTHAPFHLKDAKWAFKVTTFFQTMEIFRVDQKQVRRRGG
ncbi:hypothetical protein Isop_0205 [Isosphaera pallida ATCC 43644]|uniref:Uncharacterized protein n=1 Tax=Isosphaera pallida (strain ATCC 43644 / DSM 9630 / IS1B) TaxID=575540 RepID=E8QWB5_ISOPI|nr:hypothetical protein Isop_0205 [Isosphaera pallida ATCC 43644]